MWIFEKSHTTLNSLDMDFYGLRNRILNIFVSLFPYDLERL